MGFTTSRVRDTSTSEIQFNFLEDVLLNGMVISTNKDNFLQAFRLRANVDKASPYSLVDVFGLQGILPNGAVS